MTVVDVVTVFVCTTGTVTVNCWVTVTVEGGLDRTDMSSDGSTYLVPKSLRVGVVMSILSE